ncbi:MAG: hypothetical protein NWF11_07025 [Candidatus Bathyarchaeota archaeon]|nr:hypothetical protein [Candidatus Bathyarchaeota archaeon]
MPGPPGTGLIISLTAVTLAIVAGYLSGRFKRHRAGLFVAFSPLILSATVLAGILIYGLLIGALVYFYPASYVWLVFFYSITALIGYYIGWHLGFHLVKGKSS